MRRRSEAASSSRPASPPNTFLDRLSSSTLPIPVQPVTQVKLDKSVFDYHVVWLQPSLFTTSFKHVAVGMHPIVPPLTLIWGKWSKCKHADWTHSAKSGWYQSAPGWPNLLFFWEGAIIRMLFHWNTRFKIKSRVHEHIWHFLFILNVYYYTSSPFAVVVRN